MNRAFLIWFIGIVLWLVPSVGLSQSGNSPADEMTKGEAILVPQVPEKKKKDIADYMHRQVIQLQKKGYKVSTTRKGEVIVVTIPAHDLFGQNETVLTKAGESKLEPLMAYLAVRNRFKLVVAMHSDNTGSEAYKNRLTGERLNSVVDFMQARTSYPEQITGYALADDEPLTSNDSRENRELNRRLEIYIVPLSDAIQSIRRK